MSDLKWRDEGPDKPGTWLRQAAGFVNRFRVRYVVDGVAYVDGAEADTLRSLPTGPEIKWCYAPYLLEERMTRL